MGFEVTWVPVLDKVPCFCCSCELKLGTCILGWLSLIACVVKTAIDLVTFEDTLSKETQGGKILILTSAAVGVLISGLLLYGAHKERPGFMVPWLVVYMADIVVVALALVVYSIILFISKLSVDFLTLILGELIVALVSFFWVVIYGYYRKLEERRGPHPAAAHDNVIAGTMYQSHLHESRSPRRKLDFLMLEDGTDTLSQNIGKGLPLSAAQYPRRAQIS